MCYPLPHFKSIRYALLIQVSAVVLTGLVFTSCGSDTEGGWKVTQPEMAGLRSSTLKQSRDFALQGGGSGYIIRSGQVVMAWGSESKLYDLKSSTKSIGVTALGLAISDGLTNLNAQPFNHLPSAEQGLTNNRELLRNITVRQLASHTAGFDKYGGFCDLLFEPGSAWAYSDCGANWLSDYLTSLFGEDLESVLFRRVFKPIGISAKDLQWRKHAYRDANVDGIGRREFGSGMRANIDAMARIGQLYLTQGQWNGRQLLSSEFIQLARKPLQEVINLKVENDSNNRFQKASNHYGLLWWNNGGNAIKSLPPDTFWSWGADDSIIAVIPSYDIVAVRAGGALPIEKSQSHFQIVERFLNPIVRSVNEGSPYPNSKLISGIRFGEEITRLAEGSDNWPLTMAADGTLFTVFGDGWGFEPKIPEKLSLGFATIVGHPPELKGFNFRSASGEQHGDGKGGKKASSLLMIDSVLYMWVRNADLQGKQCQLAYSDDGGISWNWSDWRFEEFGYCVFNNYGADYEGAPDDFVYVYSPSTDHAYRAGDGVYLARVSKNQVLNADAYKFFAGLDADNKPLWSSDILRRQTIFEMSRRSNRLDVVYNDALAVYLLTMRSRGEHGGSDQWSMFEAPSPWGPWRTIYYSENWDVDPGEALRIPSKWISSNGSEFYLVFSGDDAFNVRRVDITVRSH